MTVRPLALAGQLLLALLYAPVAWSACEPGHMVLQVLGSGGPEMDDKRTLGREKQATGFIRKSWQGPLHFANDLDRFNP